MQSHHWSPITEDSLYTLWSLEVPLTVPSGRSCRCRFLIYIRIFLAVPVMCDKLVLRSLRIAESSMETGCSDADDASWRSDRVVWGTEAALMKPHIVAANSPRSSTFTMTGTYCSALTVTHRRTRPSRQPRVAGHYSHDNAFSHAYYLFDGREHTVDVVPPRLLLLHVDVTSSTSSSTPPEVQTHLLLQLWLIYYLQITIYCLDSPLSPKAGGAVLRITPNHTLGDSEFPHNCLEARRQSEEALGRIFLSHQLPKPSPYNCATLFAFPSSSRPYSHFGPNFDFPFVALSVHLPVLFLLPPTKPTPNSANIVQNSTSPRDCCKTRNPAISDEGGITTP